MTFLAKRLLVVLAMTGALSGCLLPQNDTVLPSIGAPLNHPPRIAEELMPVSRFITASLNPSCPTYPSGGALPFNDAIVDEPDLADETHWRLYLDWNPTTNNLPLQGDFVPGQSGPSTLRSILPQAPVALNSTTVLGTPGTHTVELWITDGPADDITSRRPASFPLTDQGDGGTLDQYYVATYARVVTITATCQ
jgi:hypothetical protein